MDTQQLTDLTQKCIDEIDAQNLKAVGLVSGPACGKSTLIKAITAALTTTQANRKDPTGLVIADMSDIIQWHRKAASSPLREIFVSAQADQAGGALLDDRLIFAGLACYLAEIRKHRDIGTVTRLLISGFPRKEEQCEIAHRCFASIKIVYIDVPEEESRKRRMRREAEGYARPDDAPDVFERRWKNFHKQTFPTIKAFADCYPDDVLVVNWKIAPWTKAQIIIRELSLPRDVTGQLVRQICTEGTEAWEILDKAVHPEKYGPSPVGVSQERQLGLFPTLATTNP